jgi:hypothetical protein
MEVIGKQFIPGQVCSTQNNLFQGQSVQRKTIYSRASLFNTKPTWICTGMVLRNCGDSDEKSPAP